MADRTPLMAANWKMHKTAAEAVEFLNEFLPRVEDAEVPDDRLAELVVAYEPIWAIGTGNNATPGQAQEAIALIRELVAVHSPEGAGRMRVLYGGPVKLE